ncbi:MAG: DUF1684 domain-containing protein [Candidatus Levybacteria bacterium]|nr:DUF1684 domain-containing protein [Candidatus Levybacteria bacterium]
MAAAQDYFDLYDYRQRVFLMYKKRNSLLQQGASHAAILKEFREEKDELFASHPQSALDNDQRTKFKGLSYFPYSKDLVFEAEVIEIPPRAVTVPKNPYEAMTMTSIAQVTFAIAGQPATLSIYWIDVYGGGLFLPFHDGTSPDISYGAGRYLFDTIKGSSFLESTRNGKNTIILDFNYAYNPSCAYNPLWVCPLAPVENRITPRIEAGEKKFEL